MSNRYEDFYSEQYKADVYGNTTEMQNHAFYNVLKNWLGQHEEYRDKKFLEVGSGRGALQDVVCDYTGIDYADSVEKYYHKPFYCGSAEEMPFEDNSFDVVWSYAVWEHIPNPEKAFLEVIRVLKGGYFIFCPAWHCRPWFAKGYQVRPYSDFKFFGKLYKFFIPLFEWLPLRMSVMLVKRILIYIRFLVKRKNFPLYYKKLKANYEVFWQSDSDACNNLDPFPVILWFESRGCKCTSHPTRLKQFLCRTGTIELKVEKIV